MSKLSDFFSNPIVCIIYIILSILLLIGFIVNVRKINKIQKKYNSLMIKLGNGNNLEVMLNSYIEKVKEVENSNIEIKKYCEKLNNDISKCIQKIGIVRYSAYENAGSDLSFALALLDKNNNGVVINGIYWADSSNTYSKPIRNGQSEYTLSTEEKRAIYIAIGEENN